MTFWPFRPLLGLRGRFVALTTATAALLSVCLLYFLPARLDEVSRGWAESRSLGIARVLGRACTVPLDFDDGPAASRMLADLEASRGAVYAVLRRADGSTLARWGSEPPGEVARSEGLLTAQVQVHARQAGTGTLELGFDTRELEERRRQTWLVILGSVIGVLVLVAVPTALAAGSLLGTPLRRMTAVAGRVARGDAEARALLPVDRRDELGTLAREFDHMLDSLYEKEAGISALAARLEQRVAERTVELQRANHEIADRLHELRRTQEQLVTADRRITIGRLTAGITHEINNPLAYIKANLEFIRSVGADLVKLLREPSSAVDRDVALGELAESADDALSGVARVRHIVRGLKNFARSDAGEESRVSIAGALEAAVEMCNHEVKGRAQLVVQVGPLPEVVGHEVRLSQVFVNLLVNAAQAIPEGQEAAHEIRVTGHTGPGGEAVVEVRDTGCGIPPAVRARLFEPFFTTKPVGVGTGLGLAITRDIVEKCGGRIEVESPPGRGSLFRVVIPAAGADRATDPPTAAEPAPQPRRRRLLVVDDEPLVRAGLERSLGRDHEVVAVPGGREALDTVERGPRFDWILCDIMMPGMDGPTFRDELASRDPVAAATIVFMSGGTLDEDRVAWLESRSALCLEKPLDLEQLGSVLDGRA